MRKTAILIIFVFSFIQAKSQTELIAGSYLRTGGLYSKPIIVGINLGLNYNRLTMIYSYSREKLSNEIFNFSSYDWNEITNNENILGIYYCVKKSEKIKVSPGLLYNWTTTKGKYMDSRGYRENFENEYTFIDIGVSLKIDYYLSPKINLYMIGNDLFLRRMFKYEINDQMSVAFGFGYRLGDGYNYKKEKSIENNIKVY